MTPATATLPPTDDLVSIITAAGGNPSACLYANGVLTVQNVTQAALDAAVAAYNPAAATPARAQTMLAAGCQIVSTGTSALNGTYACDPSTILFFDSEMASIAKGGTFTDGSTSIEWPDMSGSLHTMSVAQFGAIAAAVADFVHACRKIIIGVTGAALPPATANIA